VVAGPAPGPVGRPHRWQKRAWGDRSARQPAQVRATRLAPQALQKLPEAGLPQAGQTEGEAVIAAEAYTDAEAGKRTPGPYPTTTPGISFSGHRASFPRHPTRHGDRQTWRTPSSGRAARSNAPASTTSPPT